jgi:hypothetical protein
LKRALVVISFLESDYKGLAQMWVPTWDSCVGAPAVD